VRSNRPNSWLARGVVGGAAVLLLLTGGCASVRPCGDVDGGFVASRDQSPQGAARRRAAGPLFERQTSDDGRQFMCVRPFYSLTTDAERERRLHELLWPLGSVKHLGQESTWRFLTAYVHDSDNRDPRSRYRAMLFPFVFWGRDMHDASYFSIFPLGGTLNEFMGRDRIVYALFPLYAYSVIGDTQTWNYLWPIISRTTGDDVVRFRVWPFYGTSRDEGQWHKQFVMWPFWTHARYSDAEKEGTSYLLFPFFGRTDREDQKGWMVLPPLFRWSQSAERTELNAPWPFFQYARGDYEKLYFWPLWGRRTRGTTRSSFLLWPIVRAAHVERKSGIMDQLAVFPFVFHERVSQAAPQAEAAVEVSARYVKLWPLMSYRREADVSRLRLLELWPLKHTAPIERNLAPLWTLYSRVSTPALLEHELLWGLFRYRREGEESKHVSLFPLFSKSRCDGDAKQRQWSFLLGLLGHEQDSERSTWRVLWFLTFGD
jgi:hypothetical protein